MAAHAGGCVRVLTNRAIEEGGQGDNLVRHGRRGDTSSIYTACEAAWGAAWMTEAFYNSMLQAKGVLGTSD